MATALDVIKWALRKTKVLASGEAPSAQETADALEALNDMLAGWRINGIDIAHVALASGDAIDVPNDHLEAIKSNLAVRIGEEFGGEVTPMLQVLSTVGYNALVAYHFNIKTIGIDHPLTNPGLSD